MRLIKENRILALILIAAIVVSGITAGHRIAVENDAKSVDIVVDYNEMELLSQQSDNDVSWWLSEFADMGITKVGLHEETLKTLTESELPVKAELVNELRKDTYWMSQASPEVLALIDENVRDDFDVLVIAGSKEMYDFVNCAFEERYDPERTVSLETENGGYILIDGRVEDSLYHETQKILMTEETGFAQETDMVSSVIMYLNIGLLPAKVETIQNAGCSVEPRTLGYEGWNDTRFLDAVTSAYEEMDVVPDYWIMGSRVVPGYDDGTEKLTEYLNKNDITIGIVENTTQRQNISPDGMEDVIAGTGYDVVRVFSVWPYIQYRYGYYGYDSYEEIENSLFRAVVERNVKVIYYKPMKETDDDYTYITDIQDYRDSFKSLETRLADHGITFGDASTFEPYKAPLWAGIIIAIGAGCAALFCLKTVLPVRNRWIYILLAAGVLGVLGAYYIAPDFSALLTSFAASVMIPCMTTVLMMYAAGEIKSRLDSEAGAARLTALGAAVLLGCIVISLAGAVMTAAPVSSIDYMLELDIFRGVKLAQLLPLAFFMLLFMIAALRMWGDKEKKTLEIKDLKWILNYNIKMWMVLLAMVVGAAGFIYLARTGHESGIEASSIELLARNYLEEVLYARPRTKEFLVAFPAVMLFIYSMVRNMKIFSFIFGLAGVIGFTSITNTFMHIRTPMELGFARTGYAAVFGIVLGVIYILILEVFYRIYRKRGSRNNA